MKWNQGLSGHSLKIAETDNSPLWIAAGPGTGKTFALMRRLARLLEADQTDPATILVCTFTRTAAADLARALNELGISRVDEVRAQTIHAFCFSMLSRQEVLEATGRTPRPLLLSETRFLFEDMKQAGCGGIRECGKRLKAFSAAWARLQHEQPGWPADQMDKQFQAALHSWLLFHKAMVIGELIPEGLKYLRLNPTSRYASSFSHVMVDEYQDLNRAEQVLVELLAKDSLVVIGDEDQSIYSFKHAHPEGMVEFPNTHSNTECAHLDDCRRCARRIVEMANSLIANNKARGNRKLRPFADNPSGEVFCVQWTDMDDEASGIARFIKSRVDAESVSPGRVLVLAPRREFGYLIRDQLTNIGVLAHSFFSEEILEGDPKHLEDCQAQMALSLLILAADGEDRVALRTWCGFGSSSLNANGWSRLRQYCEQHGEPPREVLDKLLTSTLRIPHTKAITDRYAQLKNELSRIEDLKGDELIDSVFPTNEDWAKPLREIRALIEEEDFGVKELVTLIQRNVIQPELPTDVDYVRVMSLHKSKGLTADMVVIVGCLEGLMPFIDWSDPPVEQLRSLEEQRRLFYVAITRAKQTLVLSSVSRLETKVAHRMRANLGRMRGANTRTVTSRFVSELGSECPAVLTGNNFLSATATA